MTSAGQMAKEAWEEMWGGQTSGVVMFTQDQFLAAVSKAIGEAITAEREACIQIVEDLIGDAGILPLRTAALYIIEAIVRRANAQ